MMQPSLSSRFATSLRRGVSFVSFARCLPAISENPRTLPNLEPTASFQGAVPALGPPRRARSDEVALRQLPLGPLFITPAQQSFQPRLTAATKSASASTVRARPSLARNEVVRAISRTCAAVAARTSGLCTQGQLGVRVRPMVLFGCMWRQHLPDEMILSAAPVLRSSQVALVLLKEPRVPPARQGQRAELREWLALALSRRPNAFDPNFNLSQPFAVQSFRPRLGRPSRNPEDCLSAHAIQAFVLNASILRDGLASNERTGFCGVEGSH